MSAAASLRVPHAVAEITPEWLSAALGVGTVAAVRSEPLEAGMMADTCRLLIEWDGPAAGPARAIVKVAATDPRSRAAAVHHRSFEIEAAFYRELAPDLPVRVPACLWAGADEEGGNAILLEDLWPARTGDQVAGLDAAEAALATAELARLHAPRWGDPELARLGWLNRYDEAAGEAYAETAARSLDPFLERYGEALGPEATALTERFVARVRDYDPRGQRGPRTVVHADYRPDNLLFTPAGAWVIDWQSVRLANGLVDLAYLLGGGLEPAARRECERDLVGDYRRRLRATGVQLGWNECWDTYRYYAFAALTRALTTAPAVRRDERGDAMFLAMARRSAAMALELDAEALLSGRS